MWTSVDLNVSSQPESKAVSETKHAMEQESALVLSDIIE